MKKIVACLCMIMVLTIGVAAAAPAGGAPGIIDVNKIMAESPKIKALQEQLNQKGRELMQKLEAEKPNLTPEQFKQKEAEAYKEFVQLKQDFEAQIDNSIKQATEQVAKEKKLSFILYKNSVAYGGLDITQDVMNKMK